MYIQHCSAVGIFSGVSIPRLFCHMLYVGNSYGKSLCHLYQLTKFIVRFVHASQVLDCGCWTYCHDTFAH